MIMDQGWCASAIVFRTRDGTSNGVTLSGRTVVLAIDFPGPTLFDGNATARLYIDEKANSEQRRELEAIFTGKKGGLLAPLWGAVVSNWLPTEATRVEIGWGDSPSLTVGTVAQATLTPLRDQAGRPTRVEGAVTQAALQLAGMDLASSKGSRWSDPQLREWQGDSGTLHQFNWSA
jgi:hypothetical protein